MKRLIAKLGVALPIMLALAVMMPGTANATQAGAGVVIGSGNINPGLSTVPAFQSFDFTGTAAGLLVSDSPLGAGVLCNIAAAGNSSIPEDVVLGMGTGHADCTGQNLLGGTQTVSCNFTYVRVGAVVVIVGECTGVFVFVPTSVNPTKTYQLAGVAALAKP